jgi:hypothetical protein
MRHDSRLKRFCLELKRPRRLRLSEASVNGLAMERNSMTNDDRLRSRAQRLAGRAIHSGGFIRIDRAFPRELAEQGCTIIWRDIPFAAHDPATWTKPVIRLRGYGGGCFNKAANTPVLHAAFDQLVGKGRWVPRDGLGSFPVRFPHPDDPGDAGWHVDLSFPGDDCDPNERHDFSAWRVNVTSRGRALLMLFLFSDVGQDDAPTRIRVGSHMDMARFLEPAGGRVCRT